MYNVRTLNVFKQLIIQVIIIFPSTMSDALQMIRLVQHGTVCSIFKIISTNISFKKKYIYIFSFLIMLLHIKLIFFSFIPSYIVLRLVIVDRQELFLYEYKACDRRGVRSKSAGWHKNRIILNKS